MIARPFFKSIVLSLIGVLFAFPAQAQPAGARGDNFIYVVQRDDTLGSLAERFTSKPGHWRHIKSYNRIGNVKTIPVGKQILIPFKYIDTIPDRGQIVALTGQVYANEKALSINQYIHEAQVIRTEQNSSVTISLSNGSTLTIAPHSIITIQRLRSFSGTGLIDTIFQAKVGSFSADVNPSNRDIGRFEIRTPVCITGIRGTKVRNHIDTEGNTIIELLRGDTDVASNHRPNRRTKLAPNQGLQVSSKGKVSAPIALLPAPTIQAEIDNVKHVLKLSITPVPNAKAYLVRYTADPDGYHEFARVSTTETNRILPIPSSVSKRFYVQVRSINQRNIGGDDQVLDLTIPNKATSDSTADKQL